MNMWYIHSMKYYSIFKKNKIIKFAGKRIELETIILSEISQKGKSHVLHPPPSVDVRFNSRYICSIWDTFRGQTITKRPLGRESKAGETKCSSIKGWRETLAREWLIHGVADGRAEEEMDVGRITSTNDLFKKSYGNTLLWNLPNRHTYTHKQNEFICYHTMWWPCPY